MDQSPVGVVQRQLEAYNAKDTDAFLATYTPDARLLDLASGAAIATGHAEMRERYGPYFARNPDLHCDIVNRITAGNCVIDREHITGLAGGGEKFAVAVYEVDDGLIRRVWFIKG